MRVRLVRRKEDDGDLRRFTHRLHPLSWAMHDKRAVERSSQGPAAPEPRLLFLVLVGWAGLSGWRLRRQMEQREQATPTAFGQSITFPPSIFPVCFWRHAICAICVLHEIHSIHNLPGPDHSRCSELFHQQHTAPLVTDQERSFCGQPFALPVQRSKDLVSRNSGSYRVPGLLA